MFTLKHIGVLLVIATLSASAGFSQSEPLPDLVITDFTLTPSSPEPFEIVTISVTVQNVGDGSAGGFQVSFEGNGTLTKTVNGLAPGASETVRFSWFGEAGQHTLKAKVNALGGVEESNPDNNFAEKTVLVARDPLPDFVIESVVVTPNDPLPGEQTSIEIVVRNQGTLASTRSPALRVKDDLGTLATLFVDELDIDQTQTLSVNWTPQLGERRLTMEVDVLARIDELNEDNNFFSQIVTVSNTRPTGANLVVSNIATQPEHPAPGDTVTLTATVTNVGDGVAEAFEVVFQADGAEFASLQIDSLAPGSEQTVTSTFVASAAGERLVRVKADGVGTIVETNENDNASSLFIQVGSTIESCGQQVWLKLEDAAADILAATLNLTLEEVHNVFMPKIRAAIEADFEGVNIRFSLNRPVGRHSRLDFISPPPLDSRLGDAPLDFQNRNPSDVGRVYVVRFQEGLANGQIFDRSLDELAQALAKVGSHEVAHFLGLDHDNDLVTEQFNGRNLMAPNVDTFTAALFSDSFFTEGNLVYLREILPLDCNT